MDMQTQFPQPDLARLDIAAPLDIAVRREAVARYVGFGEADHELLDPLRNSPG